MALGIWLYVLSPALAVPLVLICSVSSQLSTLPSMWRLMDFRLALPFVLGGLAGMPIGALLVARADPATFKVSVGAMLVVFPTALYFVRTPLAIRFGGRMADAAVGFAGGILASPASPARCRRCGRACAARPRTSAAAYSRPERHRTRRGASSRSPAASSRRKYSGSRCWRCPAPWSAHGSAWTYRTLNDRNFYDIVLGLLFLSGLGLLWSSIAPR